MKTIKQIADELGVSKTAVRKKIENLGLSDKLQTNGNQFIIDNRQETLIKSAFLKSEPKTENCKPVSGESETFRLVFDMVCTLKEQLEAKDKQLAEKDKQLADQQQSIKALTEALADTATSLKAAQLLHAGTTQKEFLVDNTNFSPEENKKNESASPEQLVLEPEKKGFFKKFFGRN
jgi:predicted transcriptional regulator